MFKAQQRHNSTYHLVEVEINAVTLTATLPAYHSLGLLVMRAFLLADFIKLGLAFRRLPKVAIR